MNESRRKERKDKTEERKRKNCTDAERGMSIADVDVNADTCCDSGLANHLDSRSWLGLASLYNAPSSSRIIAATTPASTTARG